MGALQSEGQGCLCWGEGRGALRDQRAWEEEEGHSGHLQHSRQQAARWHKGCRCRGAEGEGEKQGVTESDACAAAARVLLREEGARGQQAGGAPARPPLPPILHWRGLKLHVISPQAMHSAH